MIGPYRVTKTLGQGSYGKVKCKFLKMLSNFVLVGIDDLKKKKVAIKMISKSTLEESVGKLKEKLKMEIKTMKLLDHPNIVKLVDVIENEEHVCIILDYCQSGEYFELI